MACRLVRDFGSLSPISKILYRDYKTSVLQMWRSEGFVCPHVLHSWAGSLCGCGARLTCTFTRVDVSWLRQKQGSFSIWASAFGTDAILGIFNPRVVLYVDEHIVSAMKAHLSKHWFYHEINKTVKTDYFF